MSPWILLIGIVGAFTIAVPVFLVLIYIGFRMGRQTIGQPLPPIIKPKQERLIEEDPWFLPMTGQDQPSYPTVEERK